MTKAILRTRAGAGVDDESIAAFSAGVRGEVIRPGDAGYDRARRIWNAMIDRRPGLILRCSGTADVVAAVRFAREHDILVAVRGGGHNVGGRAVCDDGLVIDLSPMKGVFVDPATRMVRVQGGATLGDVDRETHLHRLAVPFGVISKTGVGGLTLGGGVGWLVRRYGPTCDNVLSAEVVTAEGKVLTASDAENPDLYWALRGGGGNFGIVTSFLYSAHPVATVFGGLLIHPRDATPALLRAYRDFMVTAPEDLTVYAGLVSTPDGTPATALIACWIGADAEAGARALQPLRAFGTPMLDALGPMPFPAMQSILDAGFPEGTRNYWKSAFVSGLTDPVIDLIVDFGNRMTSPLSALLVEFYGGASGRRPADANAFGQRNADYCIGFLPQWTDAAEDADHIGWARAASEAIRPHATGGYLLNYLSEEGPEVVRAAFGPNYDRLREMKTRYDPENFFSINQNIQPA